MRDPYLYEDVPVLRNKLGIKTQKQLDDAEADYVVFRLKDITMNPIKGEYDVDHLLRMHRYIFQDIYEWAGDIRKIAIYKEEDVLGGLSVEYSDPFDIYNDLRHTLSDLNCKRWLDYNKEQLVSEFSDSMAKLWKVHPFREGNTRTTVNFCCQYAEKVGLSINRKLFEDNARYVRTALVAYNAYFSDGSDFSKKEYLIKIVDDALDQSAK